MTEDYIHKLPLTKWVLNDYEAIESTQFPGGGKTNYAQVLVATHQYLNKNVHSKVEARSSLVDGIYRTDHGPDHIRTVLSRASNLCGAVGSGGESSDGYVPILNAYETFLLTLAIHFHDVGNMYGRDGHEKRILDAMENVGVLDIGWHEKNAVSRIATCHGGTIHNSKDTITQVADGIQKDGDASYRPRLLAAILRLADELSDEHSRADSYGLRAGNLPPTCLLFHKYAAALRVDLRLSEGHIALRFNVFADDLRQPFKKMDKAGVEHDRFFLDEIYERTLKTYNEAIYCGKYMRQLDYSIHEVRVEIDVYESEKQTFPNTTYSYIIGDIDYPMHGDDAPSSLERIARGFKDLPTGEEFAAQILLTNKKDSLE